MCRSWIRDVQIVGFTVFEHHSNLRALGPFPQSSRLLPFEWPAPNRIRFPSYRGPDCLKSAMRMNRIASEVSWSGDCMTFQFRPPKHKETKFRDETASAKALGLLNNDFINTQHSLFCNRQGCSLNFTSSPTGPIMFDLELQKESAKRRAIRHPIWFVRKELSYIIAAVPVTRPIECDRWLNTWRS